LPAASDNIKKIIVNKMTDPFYRGLEKNADSKLKCNFYRLSKEGQQLCFRQHQDKTVLRTWDCKIDRIACVIYRQAKKTRL